MSIKETPPSIYRQAPPTQELTCCPKCGTVLDHFAPRPVPVFDPDIVQRPAIPQPPAGYMRLPEYMQEPEKTRPAQAFKPTPIVTVDQAPVEMRTGDPWAILDDPAIGGKFTVVVCLRGDNVRVHKRALGSIMASLPAERMHLRLVTSDVGIETNALFSDSATGTIHYPRAESSKGELMREAFQDKDHPITTPYTVWFDQTAVVRKATWAAKLAESILAQPAESRVGIWGVKRRETLRFDDPGTRAWFQDAPWFRGRDFRNKFGAGVPNGTDSHFVLSHFFCIRTEAIQDCMIPDARVEDVGLSLSIGEQLYQGGWATKMFDSDHRLVGVFNQPSNRRIQPPWYPR